MHCWGGNSYQACLGSDGLSVVLRDTTTRFPDIRLQLNLKVIEVVMLRAILILLQNLKLLQCHLSVRLMTSQ